MKKKQFSSGLMFGLLFSAAVSYGTTTQRYYGSLAGTADAVANATFTTALTVNGGAVTITGPAAGATLAIPTGGGTLGSAAFTAASAYATAAQGTTADNAMPKAGGTFTGSITMTDAFNIILGTSTGTKIGTSTTQKLGFYNSTPIVQPSGDIVTALQNLGLVSTGTVALAASATTATNMAGGAGGSVPYQTGSGATAMLPNGSSGQFYTSQGGTNAPVWSTATAAGVGAAPAYTTAGGMTCASFGGLSRCGYAGAVANNGTVTLPTVTTGWSGHGFITIGTDGDRAEFTVDASGNVNLAWGSSGVVTNSGAASKVQVGGATPANPVVITNATGSSVNIEIAFDTH